jgi:hypothetical protein
MGATRTLVAAGSLQTATLKQSSYGTAAEGLHPVYRPRNGNMSVRQMLLTLRIVRAQ